MAIYIRYIYSIPLPRAREDMLTNLFTVGNSPRGQGDAQYASNGVQRCFAVSTGQISDGNGQREPETAHEVHKKQEQSKR